MPKKLTCDDFKERARKIHGNRYDYSKVEYVNSGTKVCVICPIHGDFYQKANDHLRGCGCQKCGYKKIGNKLQLSTNEFVEKAQLVHGDKYDYSKVIYTKTKENIVIICHIHGEFLQKPNDHLSGCGCPKCGNESVIHNISLTKDDFIIKSNNIHRNMYDYSKVEYINNFSKVCIICSEHGEFWQEPKSHLKGHGCPKCGNSLVKTSKECIEDFKKVHGDKYDYSNVEYVNSKRKVNIICPEHGIFKQTPNAHLKGCGCPRCSDSKLEREVAKFLGCKNIKLERQKRFYWLGKQRLDFYLPDYNIAIECQGEQHFKPVDFAGRGDVWANKLFLKNQERDKLKLKLCKDNNIRLLYYSSLIGYDKFLNEKVYRSVDEFAF